MFFRAGGEARQLQGRPAEGLDPEHHIPYRAWWGELPCGVVRPQSLAYMTTEARPLQALQGFEPP